MRPKNLIKYVSSVFPELKNKCYPQGMSYPPEIYGLFREKRLDMRIGRFGVIKNSD